MSKILYISLFWLLISPGLYAQTTATWQAIGAAGGISSDSQYSSKSMAGFFTGGSADDGTNSHWAGFRFFGLDPLDVEENDYLIPREFALGQNYPNPFNPATKIEYSLAKRSDVRLTVYNILGQCVVELVNKNQTAGEYSITWDGRNESGAETASGVYFYRLVAGDFTSVKKMLLVK